MIDEISKLEKEIRIMKRRLPKVYAPAMYKRSLYLKQAELKGLKKGIKIGEQKAFYKQERPMSKKTLKELEDISKGKVKFYDIKDNMIFVRKAPCVILLEPLFQEREQKKAEEKSITLIHKSTQPIPNDGNVWTMVTACGTRAKGYGCSYQWKKVTCKNCLRKRGKQK